MLAGYLCLSILLYGRGVIGRLSTALLGSGPTSTKGSDQGAFVWFLQWGARSISQLKDPLSTVAIYVPHGWNLAWATSLPGPAALLTPLTLLAGPVVSFNVLDICAPAFAAWTAYLFCRQLLPAVGATGAARHIDGIAEQHAPQSNGALAQLLTTSPAPAIAGGLLFGFGTYETVEMINHVNLALIALLPLLPLLLLRRHTGVMCRGAFIAALGVVLAAQMLTSTEVLATSVMFASFGILLWAAFSGPSHWRAIALTTAEALWGLLLAVLLSAPFLYQAFHFGNPVQGIEGSNLSVDVANLLTTTRATWVPGIGGLLWSAQRLHSNITEQTGYLGLPLLIMLAAFAFSFRRRRVGWWLIAFIALVMVLCLGRTLIIDGRSTLIALPWTLIAKLPLLQIAAPTRFPLYLWLAVGVATCLWLASGTRRSRPAQWALFAIVCVSLMPNLTGISSFTPVDRPGLLRSPLLRKYVPPDSVVLALPYGSKAQSMLWQVEARFEYRMAGGYASFKTPPQYSRWKHLFPALSGRHFEGDLRPQLCAFLRYTGTTRILLRDRALGQWHRLLGPLHIRPIAVGGFHVYQLTQPACSRGAPAQSRLRSGSAGS